jgi:hypothetical protein
MIENWIDSLVKIWEVSDGKTGTVQSYRIFTRDEFPEDVPLDRATCLTFVDDVDLEYSVGGPRKAFWHGSSYFHVTPDLARSRMPSVLRYFNRIIVAAAGNLTLGGLVDHFVLESTGSISIVQLKYGNEAPHVGLEVKWIVKETINGLVVQ